jgi:hypothetical protein
MREGGEWRLVDLTNHKHEDSLPWFLFPLPQQRRYCDGLSFREMHPPLGKGRRAILTSEVMSLQECRFYQKI